MKISQEGYCLQALECMPTRHNPIFRTGDTRSKQKAFIEKNDCFLSGGRLYVRLKNMVADAITGTLYSLSGHCKHLEAGLFVDMSDVNSSKDDCVRFILEKY